MKSTAQLARFGGKENHSMIKGGDFGQSKTPAYWMCKGLQPQDESQWIFRGQNIQSSCLMFLQSIKEAGELVI